MKEREEERIAGERGYKNWEKEGREVGREGRRKKERKIEKCTIASRAINAT